MGLSILKFTYAGDTDFDLNFALGYASKTDVACYVDGADPFTVSFDWLTDSQVRITPTDVLEGDTVVFTRTVDKTSLPVDLTTAGNLTRANVETCVLHSLYAQHELLDGRFGEVLELTDAVLTSVSEAVSTALEEFLFQATFKRDIVLHPGFTEATVETYTTGGEFCDPVDVLVQVTSAPAVTTEYLVYNNDTLVFTCTVDAAGEVVSRSTDTINLEEGSIRVDVTGSNYVSGIDLWLVLPMKTSALADFDVALSDYVEIFDEARNA